tara:strand:- start:569 stop:1477 length:909 start_codon:yes stop_codon:yes gene_type:complete
MDLKSKIILIAGPTSSGKTKFAIQLAKKIKGEIINADSMQVYKELKILTARPTVKDKEKIKHHLFGFKSVKDNFSTGQWLKLVVKKVKEIKKKNKAPILVGGTGLYFKALTDGLVVIPKIPFKIRNKIRQLQKKIGQKQFYKKLINIDPLIKGKIIETDIQRSVRAYEVKFYTKKSIVDWFKNTKPIFLDNEFIKIYIDFPREDLIKRISKRTSKMFNNGVIKEVESYLKLKVKKDSSSHKVIGISEIEQFLRNKTEIKDIIEKISIKTRQYAKRQATWARGQMINWLKIKPKDLKKFLKKI